MPVISLLTLFLSLCLTSRCSALISPRARGRSKDLSMSAEDPLVKLPIVQLVEDNIIIGEFVMGGALERSTAMFQATMEAKAKDLDDGSKGKGNAVDNVYSDEHLLDVFARDGVLTVLKLHKIGCRKCTAFEQTFFDMAKKTDFPDGRVKWITAEVGDVPEYIQNVKERLLGEREQDSTS